MTYIYTNHLVNKTSCEEMINIYCIPLETTSTSHNAASFCSQSVSNHLEVESKHGWNKEIGLRHVQLLSFITPSL